jgi:LacI family transcriptional regulator
MQTKESSVSIIDVSRRAGISPMTVSGVIRNNDNVSISLRSKVLEAVKELGYVPSASARDLRNGSRTEFSGGLLRCKVKVNMKLPICLKNE